MILLGVRADYDSVGILRRLGVLRGWLWLRFFMFSLQLFSWLIQKEMAASQSSRAPERFVQAAGGCPSKGVLCRNRFLLLYHTAKGHGIGSGSLLLRCTMLSWLW